MQEKVLSNRKNGMAMMLLFHFPLCRSSDSICSRLCFYTDSLNRDWFHLDSSRMGSISWTEGVKAPGSFGAYIIW